MTKFLWHSNSPFAPTGYGNQTSVFSRFIVQDYDLALFSFYGLEGQWRELTMQENGKEYKVLELPRGWDLYGNDIIQGHYKYTKSDIVISLIDPFALNPDVLDFPWCSWVPVDSTPVPAENVNVLQKARWTWAMSKFGERELAAVQLPDEYGRPRQLFDPIYVPHGVDTNTFAPGNRDEIKARVGKMFGKDLDKSYLVVTVAANKGRPSRKNFAGMFEIMHHFMQAHEDVVWYIHTWDSSTVPTGENLQILSKKYGLEDRVLFPHPYHYVINDYPPPYLNDVYNAADVFLLLSLGEGFGLPAMEAQAAGCPVILTNGSAQSELCLSGHLVDAMKIQCWDGREGCQWWLPAPPLAVQALEAMYADKGNQTARTKAHEKARSYDARVVYDTFMKPALERMITEYAASKPAEPVTDSRKRRKARQVKVDVKGTVAITDPGTLLAAKVSDNGKTGVPVEEQTA